MEVTEKYKPLEELYRNVCAQSLAKETGIRKDYTGKIKREVDEEGLAHPKRRANQIIVYKVLAHLGEKLLLTLRKSNPRRSQCSYRNLSSQT
eukprot:3580125-Ditylum_brightwellii.AAC.1